jgi:hypothetical protein
MATPQGKSHGPQGELSSMHNPECCHRGNCSRAVVVAFRAEALCLEHFCGSCYEFLEGVDRHQQSSSGAPVPVLEHLFIADECARRVLEICMSATTLNNLERARLLDILLWCGDISSSYGVKNARETTALRMQTCG